MTRDGSKVCRSLVAAAGAALLVAALACTSSAHVAANSTASVRSQSKPRAAQAPARDGAKDVSGTSSGRTAVPAVGPSPMRLPYEPDTMVDATLSASCVMPGGLMTLRVNATPKSNVAFVAVYSDNKSGAEPPGGAGYGGNDGGAVDESGYRTFTWAIAATAPLGPARVDVVAYLANGDSGYSGLPFTVARTCAAS